MMYLQILPSTDYQQGSSTPVFCCSVTHQDMQKAEGHSRAAHHLIPAFKVEYGN